MHPDAHPSQHKATSPYRVAARITGVYAAVGVLWVLFSDRILTLLVIDHDELLRLQTYKGWVYVACTAALLAWLILRHLRQSAEEQGQVWRLNRTYRLLSGINSAIVRVRACEELLHTVCDLVVREGHFLGARIFLHDGSGASLQLVAQAGSLVGLPALMAMPEAESMRDTGSAKPVWINQLEGASLPSVWVTEARGYGTRAIAAVPIPGWSDHLPVRGWLELYSRHEKVFDAQEIGLLQEIAADIALGIETIEKSNNLHTLAYYDALTGLANAALLTDHLQQTLARALHDQRTVGVVVVDCPEMTRLADVRGRHLGDRLRKEVADYLAAAVRDGDTVARTGQDEFTLVLADMARSEDMVNLSGRLLRGPAVTLEDEPLPLPLPLRGGVALYPVDADDAETLIQHATLTLHSAAIAPGTCVFYSSRLNAVAQAQLQLEHELQHAIERNELRVVYQPVVDARTQQPVGAEALLRWHNGTLGEVGPARFIPVAEACGFIHVLGRWVMEQVCRQIAAWRAAGIDIPVVSVNVAAPQLLREGFLAEFCEVLESAGLSQHASGLAIEITETAIMHDIERAITVLRRVRDLGVRIYLDDFGTGYSSLGYLSQLPVDVLKIDYGFVSRLPDDQRAVSLVKAIIALAHNLGIDVVAEGVETPEQLRLLRKLHCDLVQGYLLGRPAPAGDVVSGMRLGADSRRKFGHGDVS